MIEIISLQNNIKYDFNKGNYNFRIDIMSKIPEKQESLYEGKAKIIYKTDVENIFIVYFKDDTTAFNNQKFEIIDNKGVVNNYLSEYMMSHLTKMGIENHFVKRLSDREQLVKKVEIIPLEVVVRNIASGSFSKKFNIEEGKPLPFPLVEFYLKDDKLGDPILTDDQIKILSIADEFEIDYLKEQALKVNYFLSGLFAAINVKLVDFKLEFGYCEETGSIILADEISPDSCRLWDMESRERMDKDLFRKNLGNLVEGYIKIAKRFDIKIPIK